MAVVGRNNLSANVLESATDLDERLLGRLADGPQSVRVVAYVLPVAPGARAAPARPQRVTPGSPPPAPPAPEDDPARVRIELEAPWTLTPADQPPVGVRHDPSLRPAVEKALRVARLDYDVRFQTPRLTGQLFCEHPPVTLTGDIFIRVGYSGRLWAAPLVCGPPDRVAADLVAEVPGPGMEAATVDVVVRPSVAKAVRTVEVAEIWGGEIVIKGVPVHYPNGGMATTP